MEQGMGRSSGLDCEHSVQRGPHDLPATPLPAPRGPSVPLQQPRPSPGDGRAGGNTPWGGGVTRPWRELRQKGRVVAHGALRNTARLVAASPTAGSP